jgi:adenosylcobinamide-GDP ribazoletransferase
MPLHDAWRALNLAGRFMTRWPFPAPADATLEDMARSSVFFPIIGLLLGAVLAGVALAAQALLPLDGVGALVPAVLLLGLWVWSTGALHLDGLADCADAWVGGLGSRERTLEIMKDPRTGAMGVVALVLVLLAKLAALAALLAADAGLALLALPLLARTSALWLLLLTPPARSSGLGAAAAAGLPRAWARLAAVLGGLAALALLATPSVPAAVAAAAAALLTFRVWRASLLQRLGGHTGDGIGALIELTELVALLAMVLALGLDMSPAAA